MSGGARSMPPGEPVGSAEVVVVSSDEMACRGTLMADERAGEKMAEKRRR